MLGKIYALLLKQAILTPIRIWFFESKAAAKIRTAWGGFLSTSIRQANRDIVLLDANLSDIVSSPGIVSMTMKSTCVSADLPIWNMSVFFSISHFTTDFVETPLNEHVKLDWSSWKSNSSVYSSSIQNTCAIFTCINIFIYYPTATFACDDWIYNQTIFKKTINIGIKGYINKKVTLLIDGPWEVTFIKKNKPTASYFIYITYGSIGILAKVSQ